MLGSHTRRTWLARATLWASMLGEGRYEAESLRG